VAAKIDELPKPSAGKTYALGYTDFKYRLFLAALLRLHWSPRVRRFMTMSSGTPELRQQRHEL
jgi:hypothetical protein